MNLAAARLAGIQCRRPSGAVVRFGYHPGTVSSVIDEGFQAFLARAANHRLLSPVEEKKLARAGQAGDERARHQLIECNLRLVISIAQYYRHRGIPMADVVQYGCLGLDRAARKFDAERGLRFSTYATLWIRQSIQRGLSESGSTIRLPLEVAARRAKARARAATSEEDKTIEELAVELEMEPEQVRAALEAAEVVVSLDRETGADDSTATIMDGIADPHALDPGEDLPFDSALLYEALDILPEEHRQVLVLRFGLDGAEARSLSEVAEEMNRSVTYVQSAQREALRCLREYLDSSLV